MVHKILIYIISWIIVYIKQLSLKTMEFLPPYKVIFRIKNVLVDGLKYLEVPVLSKNFTKTCLFVSWTWSQLFVCLNFNPLQPTLPLTKNHNSCWSYSTNLWMNKISFVCHCSYSCIGQVTKLCVLMWRVFFTKFSLKQLRAWAETNNVLFEAK